MFKREEASRIKAEFWTTFGKYMNPILSAEGIKTNWVNYHTLLKDVHFRMNATQNAAIIYISIEHRDLDIQKLYFERFVALKSVLHDQLQETWSWQLHTQIAPDKVISRIYKEIPDVSIFNKDQWPELISFFKPRIIALDSFWQDAKYTFQGD